MFDSNKVTVDIRDAWTTKGYIYDGHEIYKDLNESACISVYRDTFQLGKIFFNPVSIRRTNTYLVGPKLFLVDADESYYDYSFDIDIKNGFIGISFNCLEEMGIMKYLKKKSLQVLDYTDDEEIEYKGSDKAASEHLESKSTLKPPGLGFSLIYRGYKYIWHKSGHVLVTANNKYYLFGQDEGQYFGVELPKKVTTIDAAMKCLTPKGAEKSPRQGEWFVVKCDKPKDILIKPGCNEYNDVLPLILPQDTRDSNPHKINAKEIIISKKGEIYAFNGCLTHPEHSRINFAGWVKFVKNTAIRSVSAEGVD